MTVEVKEFTFEDMHPQSLEVWSETYTVLKFDTTTSFTYGMPSTESRYVVNADNPSGAIALYPGEAKRYLEIFQWIVDQEEADA